MGPGGRGSLPPKILINCWFHAFQVGAWNSADLSLPSGMVPLCLWFDSYEPRLLLPEARCTLTASAPNMQCCYKSQLAMQGPAPFQRAIFWWGVDGCVNLFREKATQGHEICWCAGEIPGVSFSWHRTVYQRFRVRDGVLVIPAFDLLNRFSLSFTSFSVMNPCT